MARWRRERRRSCDSESGRRRSSGSARGHRRSCGSGDPYPSNSNPLAHPPPTHWHKRA
ncbi:hypothetical protein ANCDUO_23806 [Ancylostoma duodenale]|uniref:Uncharacterized protein n=1 Tax=Ancylostoma duodenale TaxID=51022 RepID=A0A0C2BQR3_9BILA|nr:hypothetical protein ANCDUO_23806 [Ancylostoma duodenale]